MHKKSLLILAFMFLFLPAFSEPQDNGGHAGTPPGFYDDINPEDIEKEEAEPAGEAYQTFEDETPADERSSATGEYTPTFDLSGVAAAESFMKREENHHD